MILLPKFGQHNWLAGAPRSTSAGTIELLNQAVARDPCVSPGLFARSPELTTGSLSLRLSTILRRGWRQRRQHVQEAFRIRPNAGEARLRTSTASL